MTDKELLALISKYNGEAGQEHPAIPPTIFFPEEPPEDVRKFFEDEQVKVIISIKPSTRRAIAKLLAEATYSDDPRQQQQNWEVVQTENHIKIPCKEDIGSAWGEICEVFRKDGFATKGWVVGSYVYDPKVVAELANRPKRTTLVDPVDAMIELEELLRTL